MTDQTDELERRIDTWRWAFRAYLVHVDTCPTCRAIPPNVDEREYPCEARSALMHDRLTLREEMTAAARRLGFNSATAYERARYGKLRRLPAYRRTRPEWELLK